MTREEFLDILELGLKEQSYCLCNKMLIRDKLLEIIDLLENENTYFFGLRLLEDFENKDSLKKYNIFIGCINEYILCSINVQLDNNAEIKVLKNELNRRINRDSRTDA